MRKLLFTVAALFCVQGVTQGALTLSWGYGGDLRTFDSLVQQNWWVQMYQDANDSGLAGVLIGAGGTPGGTGVGDTVLAGAQFHTFTVADIRSGAVTWGTSVDATSIAGSKVYTVLFNSSSIGGASKAVIIDSSTKTLAAQGGQSYTLTSVTGSWQTIPEPGVLSLLAIGGCVMAVRRRFVKC